MFVERNRQRFEVRRTLDLASRQKVERLVGRVRWRPSWGSQRCVTLGLPVLRRRQGLGKRLVKIGHH